jgi:hypothetical protein
MMATAALTRPCLGLRHAPTGNCQRKTKRTCRFGRRRSDSAGHGVGYYCARRTIPVYGGAVTVCGRNVPEGYRVKALGDAIPLELRQRFDEDREAFSDRENGAAHFGIIRADVSFIKSWDALVAMSAITSRSAPATISAAYPTTCVILP